jgi:hypothetical protein
MALLIMDIVNRGGTVAEQKSERNINEETKRSYVRFPGLAN